MGNKKFVIDFEGIISIFPHSFHVHVLLVFFQQLHLPSSFPFSDDGSKGLRGTTAEKEKQYKWTEMLREMSLIRGFLSFIKTISYGRGM